MSVFSSFSLHSMAFANHNNIPPFLSAVHSDHTLNTSHLHCHYCNHHAVDNNHAICDDGFYTDSALPIDTYINSFSPQYQDEPFHFIYLVNLFTAPDMEAYLAEASISDDVYALPIHLQRLISEAKEEVVFKRSSRGQDDGSEPKEREALMRLERVRDYVRLQSGGDVANLMSTLTELMNDDDELETIMGL